MSLRSLRNVAPPQPPAEAEEPAARPFLKWAGGKGQLIEQFGPLLPPTFNRYFEPFVGGAALFFALRQELGPKGVVLTDINAELIDCYRAVRDRVEDLIAALREHVYEQQHYYSVRELAPEDLDLPRRAARTIFLNRTGYNGLYRVNRSGRFNVPFGRHTNPTICNAPHLRACSAALRGVELGVRNFDEVLDYARPGDFVYLDPPYMPVSETADFTSYAPGGFGWNEQQRLARLFEQLTERGVKAMLSNSDVPEIHDLYREFRVDRVEAARSINSNAAARGKVGELVIRNFGPSRRPAVRRKGPSGSGGLPPTP